MNYADESLTFDDYFFAASNAKRRDILRRLEQQSFNKVPLLLGIESRPFESLESLLFHAAKENGMASISALCRALGLPERRPLNSQRRAQLSASLQMDIAGISVALPAVPPERERKHLVEYGGHYLRHDQLALSTTRLCPRCVAEHGYGYSHWALAPFAVCDRHGTPLIDRCPACQSAISLHRPGYAACRCGADLTTNVTPPANPTSGARRISSLLAARFQRTAPLPDEADLHFPDKRLESLGLGALIDLVTFLGALDSDPKAVRLRQLRGPIRLDLRLRSVERAARALRDWPAGFYAELRRARAFFPRIESRPAVAKSIDHVLQLATVCTPQKELRFVTEAIGQFLATPEEWNAQRKLAACGRKGI